MEPLLVLLIWVIALVAAPRFTLTVTGIFAFIVFAGALLIMQL